MIEEKDSNTKYTKYIFYNDDQMIEADIYVSYPK